MFLNHQKRHIDDMPSLQARAGITSLLHALRGRSGVFSKLQIHRPSAIPLGMACTLYWPEQLHFASPASLRGWAWTDGSATFVFVAPASCSCSSLQLVGGVGTAAAHSAPVFVLLASLPAGPRLVSLHLQGALVDAHLTTVLYTVRCAHRAQASS